MEIYLSEKNAMRFKRFTEATLSESSKQTSEVGTIIVCVYVYVCVCLCVCARAHALSHFSNVQFFVTPWTLALQSPLSMGFPRQEYWRRLPFPSSGHLPNPGPELVSPVSPVLDDGFFTTEPPGKSHPRFTGEATESHRGAATRPRSAWKAEKSSLCVFSWGGGMLH